MSLVVRVSQKKRKIFGFKANVWASAYMQKVKKYITFDKNFDRLLHNEAILAYK